MTVASRAAPWNNGAMQLTRSEFLKLSLGAALAGAGVRPALAQTEIRRRAIPSSGEELPVVGWAPGRPSTSARTRRHGTAAGRCCGCCSRAAAR